MFQHSSQSTVGDVAAKRRRPRVPPGAKRTERVLLSLRRDEMKRLEQVARKAKLPVAVFVRDVVIEALDERETEIEE